MVTRHGIIWASIVLGCAPGDDAVGLDDSPPEQCGNGQTVPGIYCFDYQVVESIVAPSAVSGRFISDEAERFAVFPLAQPMVMVWWQDGEIVTRANPEDQRFGSVSPMLAIDIVGSAEPDIFMTYTLGAAIAPNIEGAFKELVTIDLPDSAFASSGLTAPLELGDSGAIGYFKGSAEHANLWRKIDGVWQQDPTEFPVPACGPLADFSRGDFNGDGRTDLAYIGTTDAGTDHNPEVCVDPLTHGVAVVLQTEAGGLAMGPVLSTGQHKYLRVQVADFDGDGLDDVSASTVDDKLVVFRAIGDGQFTKPKIFEDTYVYLVGDVDGDIAAECIVFTHFTRETVVIDDPFGAATRTTLAGVYGVPLAVGDLNADGVGDIAFTALLDDLPVLKLAISAP